MSLLSSLRDHWCRFQGELFPELEAEPGSLPKNCERFVTVLELVRPERFLPRHSGLDGRPPQDRAALARAFMAKAVWDLQTTTALIERLEVDPRLHRLCGWSRADEVPSESTFSRAFAEFAESDLAGRMYEALIGETLGEAVVGHVSRDATAIPAREKAAPKPANEAEPEKRRRGRPRKGEEPAPRPMTRLERQAAGGMTLEQMLDDLPKACDKGTKTDAKGFKTSWTGWKLHIDSADGGIPVSCILSSASMHDCHAAIPPGRTVRAAGHVSLRVHGQRLRRRADPRALAGKRPRLHHRHQPATRRGTQEGACHGAQGGRKCVLRRSGGAALPGAIHRRTGERPAQGRVRRSPSAGARAREGVRASHVRRDRSFRGPVDAAPDIGVTASPQSGSRPGRSARRRPGRRGRTAGKLRRPARFLTDSLQVTPRFACGTGKVRPG